MDELLKIEYIAEELEAIYEDIDNSVNHLVLSRKFLKDLISIAKGAKPNYKSLTAILSKIKK